MVKVTDNLTSRLQEIKSIDLKRSFNQLGVKGIEIINNRVDRGVTVQGSKFKRYSLGYENFKLKKGRNAKVDLTFTGDMLNSLQASVRTIKGYLTTVFFFINKKHKNSKLSVPEVARQVHEQRPFFDFSDREADGMIQKYVFDPFKEELRAINGKS